MRFVGRNRNKQKRSNGDPLEVDGRGEPQADLRTEPAQELIAPSVKPHPPIPEPLGQWVQGLERVG